MRIQQFKEATIDRFEKCGSESWIVAAEHDPGLIRVRCNRCRCRWCVPCAREKANIVKANVRDACAGRDMRFITFTLKADGCGLSERLARLRASFRKLRLRKDYREIMKGGISFLEVKIGSGSGEWHPHLHCLVEGKYVHIKKLRSDWLEVTGDSHVVDIKRIRNEREAAGYIAKYAGKGFPASLYHDRDKLRELMQAMHGVRTFNVFGTWEHLGLSKEPDAGTVWVPLMKLDDAILRARKGDTEAIRLLSVLRGGAYGECPYPNWDLVPGET